MEGISSHRDNFLLQFWLFTEYLSRYPSIKIDLPSVVFWLQKIVIILIGIEALKNICSCNIEGSQIINNMWYSFVKIVLKDGKICEINADIR